MRDFLWHVRRHEKNILSFFKLPIDDGSVEGVNNNAKVIEPLDSDPQKTTF